MNKAAIMKILGYSGFEGVCSRLRLRGHALRCVCRAKRFIFQYSIRTVPRSEGERLVEKRVLILGIPVWVNRRQRAKYHIALLVDEFFGGWDTAIGGYGALARKYICQYIPDDNIQIDLLLDTSGGFATQERLVDQTRIYRLPSDPAKRQSWLDRQGYNLFLSIEMTHPSFRIISEYKTNTPLLYWIQDPRDLGMYQQRQQTVHRLRDDDWGYIKDVSIWMEEIQQRRVCFISQGETLSTIAREMYHIPDEMPIQDLPNPVEMDHDYILNDPPKEDKIIFIGRLEAQKRVWMVCEIAKVMPQYEFYILGATGKGRNEIENAQTLEPYRNQDGSSRVKNLHFTGHVDGDIKSQHIKTAKLVLNTSIWEGIPVSWLEALSYGTLIVSAFERDNIVGRFGTFVGEVMGDGVDEESLKRFTVAIEYWMTHEFERNSNAQKAIEFIRERHSIDAFTNRMRKAILQAIP